MEKLFISFKRLSFALMVGGTLVVGASSCSKGEEPGEVNVEEAEFKSKDPTDHNATGNDDKEPMQQTDPADKPAYEEVYDEQQQKSRDNEEETRSGAGAGGANNPPGN